MTSSFYVPSFMADVHSVQCVARRTLENLHDSDSIDSSAFRRDRIREREDADKGDVLFSVVVMNNSAVIRMLVKSLRLSAFKCNVSDRYLMTSSERHQRRAD